MKLSIGSFGPNCGQISDRPVPNFRRKSQRKKNKIKKPTRGETYTFAAATLR